MVGVSGLKGEFSGETDGFLRRKSQTRLAGTRHPKRNRAPETLGRLRFGD